MKHKLLKSLLIFSFIFSFLLITPLIQADNSNSANDRSSSADFDYATITENTTREFPSPDSPKRIIKEVTIVHRDFNPAQKNRASSADTCVPSSSTPTTFGLTGWKLTGLVTYRLNPSSAPSGLASLFPAFATNSFGAWNGASNGNVNFIRGANTSVTRSRYDGQNVVAWNRLSVGTIGLTTTRYYVDTGAVVDVDTILNSRFAWTWANPIGIDPDSVCGNLTRYDTQDILTHELGHWMGLDDRYHPSEKDLTMYGYGSKGELKKDTLNSGDLNGILTLYP